MEGMMSSVELEIAVLDVDGRVPKGDRFVDNTVASANLWREVKDTPPEVVAANRATKALTVWRWRDELLCDIELQMSLTRGGRDLLGTVYYLRRT
jgi:hypothetical protein